MLLAFCTACQLPDTRSFAEATSTLRHSIIRGGEVVVGAQDGGGILDAEAPAAQLAMEWNVRVETIDAILQYSDALTSIVDAGGNKGEKTAALAASVETLAKSLPPNAISSGISEGKAVAEILVNAAKQVRASRSIERALSEAHAAVVEIARILEADFKDLARIYENEMQNQIKALNDAYGASNQYRKRLSDSLSKARTEMLDARTSATVADVAALEELYAATRPEHDRYRALLSRLERARQGGLDFFGRAQTAVKIWEQAHADLRGAVMANRRPNVMLLASTATELREAIDDLRN